MVHTPVLLQQAIEHLALSEGDIAIDATAGLGGHTLAMSKSVGSSGKVIALECDDKEIIVLKERLQQEASYNNIDVIHTTYASMKEVCLQHNIDSVAGVLFDLGFSSWHIEQSGRGFSFVRDEALDMRYDTSNTSTLSAYDVVNGYSYEELERILREYGEEKQSEKIARAIVKQRRKNKIMTTTDLVRIITPLTTARAGIHPATRSFQAIRMEVNSELSSIQKGLEGALSILKSKGRVVVISFHSIEDRVIKQMFQKWKQNNQGTIVTRKVVVADYQEVRKNTRARSAKLRTFCKK